MTLTCLSNLVSSICKSAFFQIRRVSRIRKFLTIPAAKTIVHSLIASRLDYCNSALVGLPDCDISKLQSAQNVAARLVTATKKHDHITPILIELHWLPIRQCILYKILFLVYKGLHGLAPPYISALLVPHTPTRNLRSSSKALLPVPKHNTATYGACAFSHFAPSQYNKLPCEIAESASLNIFKARLNTHLFKLAFNL